MSARTALFVLGMHRSGTSALTRVFSLSGAVLPLNLYPAGVGNETGHWEPAAAIELNDRILAAAGTSVNGLAGPDDEWFQAPAAQAFVPEIEKLFLGEYGGAPLTVIKDPRLCLVFPLWRAALERQGVTCKAAIIVRNPAEVAQSLLDRQRRAGQVDRWTADRSGLLWLRYVLAAERHTREIQRTFCSYSDLLEDWRGVVARTGHDLQVAWPRECVQAGGDIDAFLSPARRHFREDENIEARSGIWSAWIGPVFHALRRSAAGEGAPTTALLDETARAFDEVRTTLTAETSSPAPRRSGLKILTRPREGKASLCFVGDRFWREGGDRAESLGMVEAALAGEFDVTILEPAALEEEDWRRLLVFAEGHGMQVLLESEGEADIQPEVLAPALRVLQNLRGRDLDAVVFQDRDGIAHAAISAKDMGVSLERTVLCLACEGGAAWDRFRKGELPSDLTQIAGGHLERKTIEQADVALWLQSEVADWVRAEGWTVGGRAISVHTPSAAVWSEVIDDLLAVSPEERGPLDARPIDVTVIVTHFEKPRLLDQALRALKHQTDPDFKVLIIDDGSNSAEALEYLAEVTDRHPTLDLSVMRQSNRYVGAARNAGIAAAETAFVIMLDDDNVPMAHMVETLKRAAASGADVATCGLKQFAGDAPPDPAQDGGGREQYFTAGPLLLGAVHNCFGDVTGIYRKAVFEAVGGFHEIHGVTFEDWQWHLRAVTAGLKLVSVPEVLLWYRVRPDSMLRTTNDRENVAVIEAAVSDISTRQLGPLAAFLIGSERQQVRLNAEASRLSLRLMLERTVAQVALIAPPMTSPVVSHGRSWQRAEGLVVTPWSEGYEVSDRDSGRTHRLDTYGSVIFGLCDGVAGSAEIARTIQESMGAAEAPLAVVEGRLEDMARAGLIVR